jgi:FkbM family methyltransferase
MKSLENLRKLGMGLKQMAYGYVAHPMTRHAPLRIALNMVGWQLRSRLARGNHHVRWISGTSLLVHSGMTGATGNIYYGLAEFHDMAFVLHLLRPRDLFVDIGANVGAYSVLAGGVCGADVIAIEPIPATAEKLNANIILNDLRAQVEVIEACIGDSEGSVRMTCDLDTTNRVISPAEAPAKSQVEVPMRRLDLALQGRLPVFIKIDTEGFEGSVLRGSQEVLRSPGLLGVSVEGNGSNAYPGLEGKTIPDWMGQFGFTLVSYDGSSRVLSTDPSSYPMHNLLFVRNLEECKQRVASAKSVEILGIPV